MTEEKTDLDLIADPGRILAVLGGSGGNPRNATVLKKIRFTWPLFRRMRAETDTFEEASVVGGALKGFTAAAIAQPIRTTATWFPLNDVIGDFFWICPTTAGTAGNANADITAAAVPADFRLYRLEQILSLLLNGAGVANRFPTINVLTGMRQLVGVPVVINAANDWSVAGAAAVTANQDASFFVPPAPGVVTENQNGAITTQAVSPLPMYVSADVRIRSTITAGVAADTHNIIALMRRVA